MLYFHRKIRHISLAALATTMLAGCTSSTQTNKNPAQKATTADSKLEQIAALQQGEKITVTNKPNETQLYDNVHYQQPLYGKILGIWHGIKNEAQLEKMGMSAEEIANNRVEIAFKKDHDMEMRTFGMAAPEPTPFITTTKNGVTVMKGRYLIKENVINIYFGRDAMEDQRIHIKNNVMTLAPINAENGFKLTYKKIADWTLKPTD